MESEISMTYKVTVIVQKDDDWYVARHAPEHT